MSSKGGLTPAQAQFFATILKNMKGKPNVDWDTVATQAGYSCAKTAQTRYGQIMKQLALDTGEAPNSTASKQKRDGDLAKSKVGSGTSLGPMKVTKSGTRVGGKVKAQKVQHVVRIWEEPNVELQSVEDEV